MRDLQGKEDSWENEHMMKRYYIADRNGWKTLYFDAIDKGRVVFLVALAMFPFACYGMWKSVIWLVTHVKIG